MVNIHMPRSKEEQRKIIDTIVRQTERMIEAARQYEFDFMEDR